MKLYAFYTPSHTILKEDWFIPSLQDDYELTIRQMEQVGQKMDHLYKSPEFKQTVLRKVGLIIQAIQDTWGEVFIFSDVDVHFFRPSQKILMKLIKGRDMLIQRNSSKGELCTGFFVCRANQKTFDLWTDVRKCMLENEDKDEGGNDTTVNAQSPIPSGGNLGQMLRIILPLVNDVVKSRSNDGRNH